MMLTPALLHDPFPLPHQTPNYVSPPELRRPLSALFPSLSFYWRMCTVIRKGGSMAAKGLYPAEAWAESSFKILRAMEYCGAVFEISGLEHVSSLEGPCVIVANHTSSLETFALPYLIQLHKDVTFIVKESLLHYPWFKYVLGSRDPIRVTRRDVRADLRSMLEGGVERLAAGISIIVFPQGSRSLFFDPKSFNSIGVKLAQRAGVPIIPLALRTDAWGSGKIFKDFGPIRPKLGARFKFGLPLWVKGNGKDEHARILRFIQSNLAAWGIDAPPSSAPQSEI